ncbi:hypothetical protein EST38_g2437 [Candolleomyces aberdarensis]|uniref:SnoaL-like domain-containing protein n=1 Tax=Candolleomyces aberdarensis TaxID=2316362 RepID=A0A4Q2DVI5_9AGAR|nr:hypothetical protein EST38_g2437 [Candolleomyces aberdarensis]
MRFLTSFLTLLLLSVSALALNFNVVRQDAEVATTDAELASASLKPKVCNPNYRGSDLGQKQYEALADYADLFIKKQDVLTAFNRYIPGAYKQHNPYAEQGRDFAIQYLINGFTPRGSVQTTNLTFFAGQGYGMTHFKMKMPNITFAVIDYFKFQGTCIVEHWDVLQQITGTEPNPIAFF